jgi:hypothetical protein
MSSTREGCWAWTDVLMKRIAAKPINARNILLRNEGPEDGFAADVGRFRLDAQDRRVGEIAGMTISMHESSVGIFSPFLGNLSDILGHAADHAAARRIDPSVLLRARLYPTMYDLTRQVGEAHRHAVVACALLTERDPPAFADNEPDFPELQARIATGIAFMQRLPPADINDAAEKEVAFTFRNGSERKFTGKSLLLTFSVPQFFFHVTTAYDILRHNGVDLVKKNFVGPPSPA